jgi:hypothetical protein
LVGVGESWKNLLNPSSLYLSCDVTPSTLEEVKGERVHPAFKRSHVEREVTIGRL